MDLRGYFTRCKTLRVSTLTRYATMAQQLLPLAVESQHSFPDTAISSRSPSHFWRGDRQEEIVRRSWISLVKPLAGMLALVMAVTISAPTFAAEAAEPAGKAAARPLSAAVAAKLSSMPVAAAAVTQEPAAETAGGKPFFKSSKGIAAIILMAGGVAYTLRSKSKDRVHSPIR
jgi:hypothetical protein